MENEKRVLSIQSHTVHGYVGNRCAVFPLQLLGFEVDAINSVQFSNHTGYKVFKGQMLDGEGMWALIEGLEANQLLRHDALLTGYVRSCQLLRMVVQVLEKLRARNEDVIYLCDPVLGDDGHLYVPPDIVPVFRDEVVPKATVITPNQYEAQWLTDISINDEADVWHAVSKLHAMGPRTVIVTSCKLLNNNDVMYIFASDKSQGRFRMQLARIDASFTGTGDLFAALTLAWLCKTKFDLRQTLEMTVATMQHVLARTMAQGGGELRLVSSAKDILEPVVTIRAERVEEESS